MIFVEEAGNGILTARILEPGCGTDDLLFGAARLNLKIVDLPVRYRERTYGDTNIQRWKHGWLLLRVVLFAACRGKFI